MPKSNSASSLNDRERGGKRRETFVEEEQPRTSTSSKDGDVRRMTFKEVTWGKQQELQVKNATDGNEATPTKIPSGAPSSPPSPILYVPPRPAPPKVSDQLESIVGIESPKALGIASTTPTLTPGPAPRPISSMPNSGLLTPTNISGSAQQTPSTVNEPLPITPSSARTSSLGWPTATANFRVSGIGFNLAAVNPAFAAISGPRRGSEGTEHVPAQVKMQLPQHRRPSAPFLTVPQDPEGYASEKEGEDEEQLEEGPPKLDLRIGVSSSTKGGGQNPSTAQKQVTETSSKAQMDLTALETRDEAMRKILEDKIRALVSHPNGSDKIFMLSLVGLAIRSLESRFDTVGSSAYHSGTKTIPQPTSFSTQTGSADIRRKTNPAKPHSGSCLRPSTDRRSGSSSEHTPPTSPNGRFIRKQASQTTTSEVEEEQPWQLC